jgi:hypothetical protein
MHSWISDRPVLLLNYHLPDNRLAMVDKKFYTSANIFDILATKRFEIVNLVIDWDINFAF